jgi:endogenous inhibitor of DNA gyrase (YacG/DUF329 family)
MNTCAWCNTLVDDGKTIWIRKNLLIGYPFCSRKCSTQWTSNKVNVSNNTTNDNSREVVQQGISGARGGEEYGGGDVGNFSNPQVVFQQAPKTVEEILAEAEMVKVKHQIEMEKQAAVDKSNKEFFDSVKKNWKTIVVFAIVAAIGIGVFSHFKANSKENDVKLSQQLEQIEDKVKLSIQSGDKEKALDLANQLVHPSHENMETQKFDAWSGYPKYDEYWSKKREEYKEQIMQLGGNRKIVNKQETHQVQETPPEQTPTKIETPDFSSSIGEWKGAFGNDQLVLTIETVNEEGYVTGFDIVKGNRRPLTGTATKSGNSYYFELKEPGNDKWDGVFKFSISGNTANGNWIANNGKSTKQFSLTI